MMRVLTALARKDGTMRLRKLATDPESYAVGGCQSVYLTEDGRFGIQAEKMDPDTAANMENLLPGEGGVIIKPEIVIEAVHRYQAGEL